MIINFRASNDTANPMMLWKIIFCIDGNCHHFNDCCNIYDDFESEHFHAHDNYTIIGFYNSDCSNYRNDSRNIVIFGIRSLLL